MARACLQGVGGTTPDGGQTPQLWLLVELRRLHWGWLFLKPGKTSLSGSQKFSDTFVCPQSGPRWAIDIPNHFDYSLRIWAVFHHTSFDVADLHVVC